MEKRREEIAMNLAGRIRNLPLYEPLVLAIPGGGLILGNIIAQELDAELDVILFEKIHDDVESGAIIGVLGEGGDILLYGGKKNHEYAGTKLALSELEKEAEDLSESQRFYRFLKKQAPMEGRSVIVVDDGIRTGETMFAALALVRLHNPRHLVVAVPVATGEAVQRMSVLCDSLICLGVMANGQLWSAIPQA